VGSFAETISGAGQAAVSALDTSALKKSGAALQITLYDAATT
jgi:hypothetical protein